MADRHRARAELTTDIPAPGLVLRQPRRGHRWGVEAYLLADFALRRPATTAIDLGTGSGILAALLTWRGLSVVAVERDPRWIELARDNLEGLAAEVIAADIRDWSGAPADVVVSNPPWFLPGSGPVSPDPWKAASRTAQHGRPEDFMATGLRHAPRVCLVGPELVTPPGAHVSRFARSDRLVVWELCPGAGATVEEPADLVGAYTRFGRG